MLKIKNLILLVLVLFSTSVVALDDSYKNCRKLAIEFYYNNYDEADDVWTIRFHVDERNGCFVILNDEWIDLFEKEAEDWNENEHNT